MVLGCISGLLGVVFITKKAKEEIDKIMDDTDIKIQKEAMSPRKSTRNKWYNYHNQEYEVE